MESEKIEDRKEIDLAVRRALVETYALKEAGLPLVMDYYSLDPTEDYAKRVAEGARFETDENGQVALVLESEELRQSILDCVTPREGDDVAVEKAGIEEEETSEEEEETLEEEEITSEEEEEESRGAEERPPKLVRGDDGTIGEFEGAKQLALEAEPLTPKRSSSELVTPRESDDAAIKRTEIEEKETSEKRKETSEEEEEFEEIEKRPSKILEGDDGIIRESEDAEQLALEAEPLTPERSSFDLVTSPGSDDAAMKKAEIEEKETSEEEEGFEEIEKRPPELVEGDDGIIWKSVALEEHLDPARSSSDFVALVPPSDTWHQVSLEDAAIKFAVSGP